MKLELPSLEDQTPLMKQYWELKAQVPDALLFFRMGDFYELFAEDAVLASSLLEITLTSRDKNKPNPMPMAGVPHHSVQGYIQKLLKSGKKIALCEQLEDPEVNSTQKTPVKGPQKIARREIVRILTPAVQFETEGSETHYLATAIPTREGKWALACLEPSTGETLVSDPLTFPALTEEISRMPIRHFLHWTDPSQDHPMNAEWRLEVSKSLLLESLPMNYLSYHKANDLLRTHYQIESLTPFISHEAGLLALGTLVLYTLRTQQQERLAHLRLPEPFHRPKSMILGPSTAQHLDISDLFQLINHTRSALGARQLKRWMLAPLKTVSEISSRQKAVKEIAITWNTMGETLASSFQGIYDLERICGRINAKLAHPRDTLALGQSLLKLKFLTLQLVNFRSEVLQDRFQALSHLAKSLLPLAERVTQIQKQEAPLSLKDGQIFERGTTAELDRLMDLTEQGSRWLIELETRERDLTGIASLKVRYNRVFGYYIEVTQTHLKNVPSHYQRKQTMVGAERFFTEELKKFEEDILTASVKQKSLEHELFIQLLAEIQTKTLQIMETARLLGELDSFCALAKLALNRGWDFPSIDDSTQLEIQAGRHPLVDQVKRNTFVPNDISLSPTTRMTLLITGPNMGGKSTVMRQVALIIILGQMGSPVPAKQAKWGVVSSLFTRIGAQDAIARGQSTFMVEMSELAHILHHGDERSLIILDEIGRGTSTYDGISVAWATLEWICTQIRARTLFATHYHELIHLSQSLPLLANAHMAVESSPSLNSSGKRSENLRFLYELRDGPTHESFGIHVAQLAGLPKPIIQRAWDILAELENSREPNKNLSTLKQLSLFDSVPTPKKNTPPPQSGPHPAPNDGVSLCLLNELNGLKINEITPLDALNWVAKMKTLVNNDQKKTRGLA